MVRRATAAVAARRLAGGPVAPAVGCRVAGPSKGPGEPGPFAHPFAHAFATPSHPFGGGRMG
ncbi:hypothetical protein AB0K74_17145, partial [Streptomyces sp. NPDC056159]|uniref:hypothetical protein n=1 Tax=Streptomyces sp. NPDC056159 TaxID=3155537 RepID=UPI003422DD12